MQKLVWTETCSRMDQDEEMSSRMGLEELTPTVDKLIALHMLGWEEDLLQRMDWGKLLKMMD